MSLRKKILISLAVIIIMGIGLASLAVYVFARNQLEKATQTVLEQSAEMLAGQAEAWRAKLRSDVILWSELPVVREVARTPGDPSRVEQACRFFQGTVEAYGIYQSVNLHTTGAVCIASSLPGRIGLRYMQKVVSTRPDFKAAAAGSVSISPSLVSAGTWRPCIAISAPVWEGNRVIAVLRTVVDLAFFSDVVLGQQEAGTGARISILDLDLDTALPSDAVVRDVIEGKKYQPPEIPPSSPELAADRGLIQYSGRAGDYLAAFHKVREPAWIIVVEMPLKEVLAPIQSLGKAALSTAAFLLIALLGVVFSILNPGLRNLLACLGLVGEIRGGNLDARLHLHSKDEIGKLAEGLNTMAESLAENRRAIEEAERTYRGIVENAVEGIFRASGDYRVVNANPSFASILGCGGPQEVIGQPLSAHFVKDEQWDGFLEKLQSAGLVEGFDLTFVCRDGTLGSGSMFARADKGEEGNIILIQGMLADVTERQKAERERQRAEEAERLLTRTRLQALRYQLNPHFLFNILNSIDGLSKRAPERIPELIRQLSRYLRFTLTDRNSDLVPFSLELEAISSYLNLEKVRFEEDLVVEIVTSSGVGGVLVPDLLLQPLVENAVKFGMKTSTMPLRVAVRCMIKENVVKVEVANTGRWVKESKDRQGTAGIGLTNLRNRMDLIFAGRCDLTLEERDGWVVARAEFPLSGAQDGTN